MSLVKRMFCGLLWLIPVVGALNLVLYLFLGFTLKESERASFYIHLSPVVQIAFLIIWYNLCRAGMLMGTDKYAGRPDEAKKEILNKKLKGLDKTLMDTTYEDRAQAIIKKDLSGE